MTSGTFVRCRGAGFALNKEAYFAVGVNCYFLGFCSSATRRSVLESAKEIGCKTLRAWAFLDVESRSVEDAPVFQYCQNGTILQENGSIGLERMDSLIAQAEELDLRLILPFVNYWPDFGGMPLYLQWLGLPRDVANFYTDSNARNAYKRWVEHLIGRRNTITGRFYFEEPSILAWELANEPRCEGRGDTSILLSWLDEMSLFVKSLDPNHLVCSGDEGFFRRRFRRSHLYDGRYGVDFEAILKLSAIDFGTYHLYPQPWGCSDFETFPTLWIKEHITAGWVAGKPVLMEEFGLAVDDLNIRSIEVRKTYYDRWIQQIREEGGGGALAWMLGSDLEESREFRDRYTSVTLNSFPSFLTNRLGNISISPSGSCQ